MYSMMRTCPALYLVLRSDGTTVVWVKVASTHLVSFGESSAGVLVGWPPHVRWKRTTPLEVHDDGVQRTGTSRPRRGVPGVHEERLPGVQGDRRRGDQHP